MRASDEEVRATVLKASLMLRCDYLTMLAEADNRGRTTPESKEPFISNIGYFAEFAKEYNCFEGPYPFKNDHSKFLYFQSGGSRDPAYLAYDDTQFEMVMMAGFPGTGKDTWIKNYYSHLPMVSLDEIRKKLKVPSGVNQSPVIIKAKERFKELLRKKQSFVFNATSLNADLRLPWINLAAQYNARIRIVYLEVPLPELLRRNKAREESDRLPEAAIYKMMAKWNMPHPSEAHVVEYHYGGQS
jgi:predicted kinase